MGGSAQMAPYLRFALVSFAATAVIAALVGFFADSAAAGRERDAAARAAAALVAEPLRPIIDPLDKSAPAPPEARASIDALSFTLGAGALEGLRITSTEGLVLHEAGARIAPEPPQLAGGAISHATARSSDGAKLFVTRLGANGYVIETAQDPAPIDDAASSARGSTLLTVAALGGLVWLVAMGAFVFVARPQLREHRRIERLFFAGERLRASMDLHDVVTQLAQDAANLGGARYSLVALFDEPTGEVVLRVTFDHDNNTVTHHQRAIDEWFVLRCVATNTTIVSTMPEGLVRALFGAEVQGPGAQRAVPEPPLLCVPLAIRDRVVGCVAVVGARTARDAFAPADVQIVEQLCAQAVTAVEQSLLFAKVRADASEIEESYDSTLKALMAALDAKDDITEGHCERVARVTLQLARSMGLPESMMVHIERGAMLHDVGKIGVPDDVLKKPGSLTEAEWTTMRKHPMLAGIMVSKVGFLEPAMPILLYHHEKFDGSGYPFGLAGANIPIEARIFTIVDAYDAMTQDRPYRDAMSHVDAMDEIRRHNGTQFDPEVVAAFEQLMANRPDLRSTAGTSGRRTLTTDDAFDHEEDPAA